MAKSKEHMAKMRSVPKGQGKGMVNRKEINFTPELISTCEALYLNGFSDEEVARIIPCSQQTLLYRARRHPDAYIRFAEAKKVAIARATKSLMKIAEGYHEYDTYYGEEMALQSEAKALYDDMLEFIPESEKPEFIKRSKRIIDKGVIQKTVKKWFPPNKDAINKLLDNLQAANWDAEARRRKIPDVKINVTVDGKQKRKQKAITPDYVIEN